MSANQEQDRVTAAYTNNPESNWLRWGPYLSERQWGTVREDYSADGNAWNYLPHDHARSRAYRWGEDGLAGISDDQQKLCFALALWNGNDPILKERLFGLTNNEGNHGEDVKEYYYYLDNTPTHSYMKYLYKYPQSAFPYSDLVNTNNQRTANDPEFELIDTGIFADDRYFDVQVEYVKADIDDILIKISVTNHGPETANIHVLPTIWFRNTWSWYNSATKPQLTGEQNAGASYATIQAKDSETDNDEMTLFCEATGPLLFVDNETNASRLFGSQNTSEYPKDGINDHIIDNTNTVRPELEGTKASASYPLTLNSGETKQLRLRLTAKKKQTPEPFGDNFENMFQQRKKEADTFYDAIANGQQSEELKMVQRQAYAGMLWSKQYFHYVVEDWLKGDPAGPKPPQQRLNGRNKNWTHMRAADVLTMPDKWEYPWFATWDLCFQTVVFGRLDMDFAKNQLRLLAHEWYMSPRGAIPAYEWSFSDVNPPLHAWAALQLFKMEQQIKQNAGESDFTGDYTFIADIFRHCLMNFTWWLNREDEDANNLFEGGFLGLDNISIVNRSDLDDFARQINAKKVELNQSDGTSWVGMFCLNMMELAIELCKHSPNEYAHLANKFLEYFFVVSDAINGVPSSTQEGEYLIDLWDSQDGFYYDFMQVTTSSGQEEYHQIKLRSLVGVIALFPVYVINRDDLKHSGIHEKFITKIKTLLERNEKQLRQVLRVSSDTQKNSLSDNSSLSADLLENEDQFIFSFVSPDKLKKILTRVLDEAEFLSPHGIRGVSRNYLTPYSLDVDGVTLSLKYEPAESSDGAFGGNSNWRGPVWFPINYMFIEKLKQYHTFLGDDFQIEYPTGSGQQYTLLEIANNLSLRLIKIFQKNDADQGNRPVYGGSETFQHGSTWQDLILFYEYFHGDNGAGIGASHQTGWTGLVAELIANTNQP